MKKYLVTPLLTWFLLSPLYLYADDSSSIFSIEIEVVDQSSESRIEAMQKAMQQILIRSSGSLFINQSADIQRALRRPERYVQQYSYRQIDVPASAIMVESSPGESHSPVSSEPVKNTFLQLTLDRNGIVKLLKDGRHSVWGTSRPAVLTWLVVEQQGRRTIVGRDDRGLARELLEQKAEERGIPLLLPHLDSTDRQRISAAEIWGGFSEKIHAASLRYNAAAILIGRLSHLSSGEWLARWSLLMQQDEPSWQQQGEVVELILAGGVHGAADRMAERFALDYSQGERELTLVIDEVNSFSKYLKLKEYLSRLEGVNVLHIDQLSAEAMVIRLSVSGGGDALIQQISIDTLLKRTKSQQDLPLGDLYYRINS